MFDISFAELMMIAVVALLVIGPDKLPQVARTLGTFVGRLQRYVAQVKDEVNRDERFKDVQALQQEIKQGVGNVESSIMAGVDQAKATLAEAEESVNPVRKSTSKFAESKAKPSSKAPTIKQVAATKSTGKKVTPKKARPKKTASKKAIQNKANEGAES